MLNISRTCIAGAGSTGGGKSASFQKEAKKEGQTQTAETAQPSDPGGVNTGAKVTTLNQQE